jgi:glycosyltransferase involved in cell wall biosynthesis
MRVLMIGDYKPQVGGPANVVQHIASFLSQDHDVSVINMEQPPYPRGLGHWFDGKISVWQEKLWLPSNLIVILGAIQKTKRALLLRNQVDLYHAHGPFNALIGLIDRSKPLVITFHGYPTLESLFNGTIKPNSLKFKIYRWIEKKTVDRADAIIVVGKRQKEWLINDLGAYPNKVFQVPNGVDIIKFRPIPVTDHNSNFGFAKDTKIIIFVKAFTAQSGISYLIHSIPKIQASYPNIGILAIGGGPLQGKLENDIDNMNLREVVKLIPRVPNDSIPCYLNKADIFISPSIPFGKAEETFNISLIEAMACGKPVIATAVGGPKEIIEGGDDVGILIPPKDPDAIANAVIELLNNPDRAKKLGENARKYVMSTYTWEKVCQGTLRVYEYANREYGRSQ